MNAWNRDLCIPIGTRVLSRRDARSWHSTESVSLGVASRGGRPRTRARRPGALGRVRTWGRHRVRTSEPRPAVSLRHVLDAMIARTPVRARTPRLPLPDGHGPLQGVDAVLGSGEGLAPMGGGTTTTTDTSPTVNRPSRWSRARRPIIGHWRRAPRAKSTSRGMAYSG
jgi:hypothetical protein